MAAGSYVCGGRLLPYVLAPIGSASHDTPDKRILRLGIDVSLVPITLGQVAFEQSILCCFFRVRAHVVAKEQSKLLAPASRRADMNVLAPRPGSFSKVPFRSLRVVGTEDVTKRLERLAKGAGGSKAATEI